MAKDWREIWFEFSQATTLHGVQFAGNKTAFSFRRLFWALIVTGGLTIFALQLDANITYYRSNPTVVNVKINHNKSLPFPAITICNQNAFRTTKAAAHGWYHDITKLYSTSESDKLSKDFQNQSMLDVFTKTAHTKEDLFVSCNWIGQDCDANDFETVVTDHGVCYTFNGKNNDAVLETSETGAEYGLKLLMNIEQYEYMPGPNDAAGLKILVHDQDEIPLVKSTGKALSPGAHVFAALKMLQIKNLPPPHGQCDDSTKLKYFDNYTVSACKVDELQRQITASCQCREMYMGAHADELPVCSVETQRTCVEDTLKRLRKEPTRITTEDDVNQNCPIRCFQTMFLSETSQSSISNFNTPKILATSNFSDLQSKFLHARETLQQVDKNIIKQDTSMIRDLGVHTSELQNTFAKLDRIALTLSDTINQILKNIEPRVLFHNKALDGALFQVQNNIVRGWNIMDERYGNYVVDGFMILASAFDELLNTLIKSNDENERQFQYLTIKKELTDKTKMIDSYLFLMAKVKATFSYRVPLVFPPYKLTKGGRYDAGMLSEYFMHWDLAYANSHFTKLEHYTKLVQGYIADMQALAKDALERKLNNTDQWKSFRNPFLVACRQFYNFRYTSTDRVFLRTREQVVAKLERFQRMNETMRGTADDLLLDVAYVLEKTANMNNSHWARLKSLSADSSSYLTHKTKKEILAKNFSSPEATLSISAIKSLITDIRNKAGDISVGLDKFLIAYNEVWAELILGSQNVLPELYEKVRTDVFALVNNVTEERGVIVEAIATWMKISQDDFLKLVSSGDVVQALNVDLIAMNLTLKIDEINQQFSALKEQSNIAVVFQGSDERYFSALEKLQSSLLQYLSDNEIDGNFVRENFVQLDIYMQDLSYEYIEQQEAYDTIALMSDIGGSMGLFIGASLITLFELFDAIGHTIGYFIHRRRHRNEDEISDDGSNSEHNDKKVGFDNYGVSNDIK